jgi:hypothetical protein
MRAEPALAMQVSKCRRGDRIERALECLKPAQLESSQIIKGGILGGKTQPVRADLGSSPLARASVLPAQSLYGAYRDRLVVHGKEKVYGSIP